MGRTRHARRDVSARVVSPETAQSAAEILASASRDGLHVAIVGAGSQRAHVDGADIVVTTGRLSALTEYEPADLTASAGAGMPLDALRDALAASAQWLPLDGNASTIGGAVAAAAAGPLRCGFGTPRDHVIGLQLVTGDGRVLELGGRVVKNVAGYDLVKLVVGSRGTLGLVTRVNLRLRARPDHDATLAVAGTLADLLELVAALRGEALSEAALELLSPSAADALLREARWTLLVRLLGNASEVADATARVRALTGGEVRECDDSIWRALAGVERSAPLVLRVADRPSRLGATWRIAESLAGSDAPIVAHAADGIVRVLRSDAPSADELAPAIGAARAQCGSVVVARAPRAFLERVAPYGDPGPALRLMRGLKRAFDPAGVLPRLSVDR